MTTDPPIPALFVTARGNLTAGGGGVQIYTRESMEVLRAAGFALTVIPHGIDRRPWTRLRRKFFPRPYANLLPPGLAGEIAAAREATGSRFVFLTVDLAPLAGALRERFSAADAQIVLLSLGLESVDYLHAVRAHGPATSAAALKLGRQLFAETDQRRHIDQVVCLAPFEAEIERWLGARRVHWLPRTVPDQTLDWRPDPARLGGVCTVNHPPNEEGLRLFLPEFARLAPPGVRFRLVGGPEAEGRALAARYPVMDYLGPLDDEALAAEAATWSAFVHPLFCYARGCSTKLAVALGWRLPVVTTPAGARGYTWREGGVACADTPAELAVLALRMLDPAQARAARAQVCLAAESAPSVSEVAAGLREMLLSTDAPAPACHP